MVARQGASLRSAQGIRLVKRGDLARVMVARPGGLQQARAASFSAPSFDKASIKARAPAWTWHNDSVK